MITMIGMIDRTMTTSRARGLRLNQLSLFERDEYQALAQLWFAVMMRTLQRDDIPECILSLAVRHSMSESHFSLRPVQVGRRLSSSLPIAVILPG